MTIKESKKVKEKYELKSVLSPDEEFLLTEAFIFLIEKTHDSRYMVINEG